MAIIRINKAKDGAAEYLVNGKASMGMHRDEYDRRVHLGGDNNTLLDATNFIKENKSWESSYRHFTLSFSADEHKDLLSMSLEKRQQKMTQMCQLMLQKYFPHRDPSDLIYQAEAHEPIGDHKAYSVRTKKMEARLLHIHLIVSNLDPVTQNKLEQISSNEDVLNTIQSDICTTFNLHDPAYIANIKETKKGLSLGDKLAKVIVQHRVESPSELKSVLIKSGLVDDISVRFSKKNGVYAVAAINKNQRYKKGKVVNLRGDRFDELLKPIYDKYYDLFRNAHDEDNRNAVKASFFDITEKVSIYDPVTEKALRDKLIKKYNKKHILSRTQTGRFKIASDHKLREEIYTDAKSKFINGESVVFDERNDTYRQQKRLTKQQGFEEFQEFKQSFKSGSQREYSFEELTRGQKNFFAVYRANINKSIIKDTKVFDDRYNPRTKVIHSKELALTILDHADEDCLSIRSYQKVNDKDSAIRLMLETAQAKGWALEDIDISGTDDFKENVERVRAQMAQEKAQEKVEKIASSLNVQEASFTSLTSESDWLEVGKSFGVGSETFSTETRARAIINRRNKGNIHNKDILKRIKENLDEDRVKRLIVSTKLNININNLQLSRNSKNHVVIQFIGEKSKALNVVDFLLKKHGMSLDKVVALGKREIQKSKEVTPEELRQILTPPFEKAEKSQKDIYLDGLRKLNKNKPAKERDQAIISKILYDITAKEIVEPVAQTGKIKQSKEEIHEKFKQTLMQREQFFKQYQQFAMVFSFRSNRDDVTSYIKENFGNLFESDTEKDAGFNWIEDQFSLMLISQDQTQREGKLSYQDAQIDMLAHLDSVPTIDEFVQQAKIAAGKGYVRQVDIEQSNTSASPSTELQEVAVGEELGDPLPTVETKPQQKTRLEIERERQRELGPFYVSPTIDLKPYGY